MTCHAKHQLFLLLIVFVGGLLTTAVGADTVPNAEDKPLVDLAKLFPSSTVAFAEIAEPADLFDRVMTHPLRSKVEALPEVQEAMRGAEYIQFRLLVSWVELQLGMSWDEALKGVTAKGVVAGVDAETEGLAVLARADKAETVERVISTLVGVARRDAKRRDVEVPYTERDYRGIKAYKFDELIIAPLGDRLLLANKPKLAKSIVDAALDASKSLGLVGKGSYAKTREANSHKHDLSLFLDLEFARDAGIAKELFRKHAEDIGAEFILGMLMEAMADAPAAMLGASLTADDAQVEFSVPHGTSQLTRAREYAFGANGQAAAPYELLSDQTIASVVSYRDLGQLWLAKEDLFEEDQVAELAQADSNLTTVFSGLDFGEEVLGSVQPGFQLIAATQTFAEDRALPVPDIRLPSFAVVFRLKNPDQIKRRFKIGFQSFVGFINIEQGQNGQPQFDVETQRKDGVQITSAQYFLDERFEEASTGLINYNFSPTIAFVDDWFMLSSTEQLANELVQKVRSGSGDLRPTKKSNTSAHLEMAHAIDALKMNREHLVAQNMLEEGNSKAEAKRQIELLLEFLAAVRDVQFDLTQSDQTFSMTLEVAFSEGDSSAIGKEAAR